MLTEGELTLPEAKLYATMGVISAFYLGGHRSLIASGGASALWTAVPQMLRDAQA
jgi:hypothetical protein